MYRPELEYSIVNLSHSELKAILDFRKRICLLTSPGTKASNKLQNIPSEVPQK